MTARQGEASVEQGLFYGLLGPLACWRQGIALDLGSPQQRHVLALLLLRRNQVVPTDHIIDSLWPGAAPPHALQTIRTYISRLRRTLDPPGVTAERSAVLREGRGYRLAVPEGSTDVEELERLALAGRNALESGHATTADADLRQALSLVRGRPLADVELDDASRYEVERLEELRLLAYEDLVEARLALGEHRALVPELRSAVEATPLRERLWSQLMLALYRAGRQVEALEVYREARHALTEQLGVEPGRELRTLERMILLQERALEHGEIGRLHGFPNYATSFVGRGGELDEIRGLLARERLVTLTGPAGVGKTRLAREVCHGVRSTFTDGIWWIDLATADESTVARAFGRALTIRETPDQPLERLLLLRLRGVTTLLVVDNCEHVVAAVAALSSDILAETAGVRILATSREPLRVGGERVHVVSPLSHPADVVGHAELLEFEAARLFLARAQAAGADIELNDSTAADIAGVVRALDGLPLAVELAAAKARTLTLADLHRRLGDRLRLLAHGDRASPPRQQTLEAAIAWSYDLLTPTERRIFLRLAVFPGSFDAQAAEAVCTDELVRPPELLPLIIGLSEKSLVHAFRAEATRFALLESVRAFAIDRARSAGLFEEASHRCRTYYRSLAEDVAENMVGPDLGPWLARARLEHDNLRFVLEELLRHDEAEAALQMASALAYFWVRTSYLEEGSDLLLRALRTAGPESRWRPRALTARAWLAVSSGAPDALEAAQEAVSACTAARRDAGPEVLAFSWCAVARAHLIRGEWEPAQGAARRARVLFAGLGHGEGVCLVDELDGVALALRGDDADAFRHLLRARDGYRQLRGTLDAGWTLVDLARVALALGETRVAFESGRSALHDFRLRSDPRGEAAALTWLARCYETRGDVRLAGVLAQESARIARSWRYARELADAEVLVDDLATVAAGAATAV